MSLLGIGSAAGLILGLIHAVYVFRITAHNVPAGTAPDRARGFYYALWTWVLWVVFGVYVLILWLAGLVFYAGSRLLRPWI